MALLKIARLGHPVLRRVADPIPNPTAPDVVQLAADMVETMIDAPGVGLAAPQVHRSVRLIVFKVPRLRLEEGEPEGPEAPVVLVNPKIEILDPTPSFAMEGCLSIPSLRGIVERPRAIRYSGVDLSGEPVRVEAEGFHARVVMHEVDHLDGIVYLDRMSDMAKLAFDDQSHHLLE